MRTPGLVSVALGVVLFAACDDGAEPSGSGGSPAAGGTPSIGGSLQGSSGGEESSWDQAAGGMNIGGLPQVSSGGAPSGGAPDMSGGAAQQAGGTGSGGDASGCGAFVVPDDCTIPEGGVLPGELRCTGLYEDLGSRTLRCDVLEYAPAYQLYSDNETKQRYVRIPPNEQIALDSPDDFVYPVGTKFWKEFWVGPIASQVIGETRLLQKTDLGWIYTAYVWNEAGTAAIQQNDGVEDLFGTGHTVPSREQCKSCHVGRNDYVLGWDALLLAGNENGVPAAQGLNLSELDEMGLLADSDGKTTALAMKIPGNAVEKEALAYLHVNCGVSCHNENVNATGKPSGLFLRLEAGDLAEVHDTDATTSAMNRPPSPNAELIDLPVLSEDYFDIRPTDPTRSLVTARMKVRGSPTAMPPLGTHDVDQEGLSIVSTWISEMSEERGYPPAQP